MSFDTMLKLNVKNVKGTEILNMALEYSLRDLYITFFKTCWSKQINLYVEIITKNYNIFTYLHTHCQM